MTFGVLQWVRGDCHVVSQPIVPIEMMARLSAPRRIDESLVAIAGSRSQINAEVVDVESNGMLGGECGKSTCREVLASCLGRLDLFAAYFKNEQSLQRVSELFKGVTIARLNMAYQAHVQLSSDPSLPLVRPCED